MPDIDTLMDQHGEDTVRKAFWLQEKIYEEGFAGVHFSEASEAEMQEMGGLLVSKAIRDEFTKSI